MHGRHVAFLVEHVVGAVEDLKIALTFAWKGALTHSSSGVDSHKRMQSEEEIEEANDELVFGEHVAVPCNDPRQSEYGSYIGFQQEIVQFNVFFCTQELYFKKSFICTSLL